MAEFGHFASIGGGMCIDTWGAGPFTIEVDSKTYRFEDSDRFGPAILNRSGDVADRQPGERNPFWRAHRLWVRQGRQLEGDGRTCTWREPKPTKYRRIGRTCVIIENGEEDGGYIEVRPFAPSPASGSD